MFWGFGFFFKGELCCFSPSWKRGERVLWGEQVSAFLAWPPGKQGMAADKQLPRFLSGYEHPELAPAFLPEALEGVLTPTGQALHMSWN